LVPVLAACTLAIPPKRADLLSVEKQPTIRKTTEIKITGRKYRTVLIFVLSLNYYQDCPIGNRECGAPGTGHLALS
jgi:hypothetical protein